MILDQFQKTVREKGGKKAVVDRDGTRTVTFRDLDLLTEKYASFFASEGLGHGDIVLLAGERCVEYAAAELGALKAGCGFCPADARYPAKRLEELRAHSGSRLTMTQELLEEIAAGERRSVPYTAIAPEELAWLLYTSGSTGTPKGIWADYRTFSRRTVGSDRAIFQSEPEDVFLATAPFCFVASKGDLLAPLISGNTVHIASDALRKDIRGLEAYIAAHGIHHTFLTPQVFRLFHNRSSSLKSVMVAGERLYPYAPGDFQVVYVYGMTEALGGVLLYRSEARFQENTPIGSAFTDAEVLLLDEEGHPAQSGEICVRGPVANGYYRDPELTRKVFVPQKDGSVLLHTGDLGRYDEQGRIHYLNRKDRMVKIGGQRVDPGEVETLLLRVEGVAAAVVRAFTDQGGRQYLCGFYMGEAAPAELRAFLEARVPAYMVPGFLLHQERFPLNASGKVDRQALAPPKRPPRSAAYRAPSNETEDCLCRAMEQVLGCGAVGTEDNFFELGADSLCTMALIEASGLSGLTTDLIYAHQTPVEIAAHMAQAPDGLYAACRREREPYPLTEAQMGIYLECVREPESTGYHIPVVFRAAGKDGPDAGKLEKAVKAVLGNHLAFGMRIGTVDGKPVQYPGPLPQVPVRRMGEQAAQSRISEWVRPFRLSGDCLFRLEILETEAGLYLLLDAHHILFDGASLAVFVEELQRAYRGEALSLEELSLPDLAVYEEKTAETAAHAEDLAFFARLFQTAERSSLFPPDREAMGEDGAEKAGTETRMLSTVPWESVREFTGRCGVTESSLFMGAFAYTLSVFTASSQAVFCTVNNGRYDRRLRSTVGMLARTVPVCLRIDQNARVEDYLKMVQARHFSAMSHCHCGFRDLAARLGIRSDVLFVYQGETRERFAAGDVVFTRTRLPTDGREKFSVSVFRMPEGYQIELEYSARRYSRELICSFLETMEQVLGEMLRGRRLSGLTLVNRRQLAVLDRWNRTETEDSPRPGVLEQIRCQAERRPERTAVVYLDKRYTYAQLERITDRIAGALRKEGIGAGDVVPVLIPRCEYIALASVGVLKAGAAYLPLDAEYPSWRLEFMIRDSGAKMLIADRTLMGLLPDYKGPVLYTQDIPGLPPCEQPGSLPSSEDLFILLYTSGTTGRPKGIMLEHRNLAELCRYLHRTREMTWEDCYASYAGYGFDACMVDLYAALTVGGELHILDSEIRLDPAALNRYFETHGITHVTMTTRAARQFAVQTENRSLKTLLAGGERLQPFTPPRCRFYNGYGPSECTVFVTEFLLDREYRRFPIGKAVDNTKLYITDAQRRRLPAGAIGELSVSGSRVGRGYWNRPEQTAFCANPYSSQKGYERLYRTGDLVRYLPDGNLDFVGRRDSQVKIRGFRVELEEIEAAASAFPRLQTAAASAGADTDGRQYLALYYTADRPLDEQALYRHLQARLPAFMLPDVVMSVPALPLTANGKVDREKLPLPNLSAARSCTAPETAAEKALAEIWTELLHVPSPGREEDFQRLGGKSLDFAQLQYRIEKRFQAMIPVKRLMEAPDLREMAAEIDAACRRGPQRGMGPQRGAGSNCGRPSMQQMEIYLACQRAPASLRYHIPLRVRLGEKTDRRRLKASLCRLVSLHPELQTKFIVENDQVLAVRDRDAALLVESYSPENERAFLRPFDLAHAPLFRAGLTEDALLLDLHHIAADGFSVRILLGELEALYAGRTPEPSGLCYADYAAWSRTADFSRHRQYFQELLCHEFAPVVLPGERAGSAEAGETASFRVNPAAVSAAARFGRANRLTEAMVYLGAYGILLAAFTGRETVFSGVVMSNRVWEELRNTVGMFVNTLPVFLSTEGCAGVGEYFSRIRALARNLLEYQELPLLEIARAAGMPDTDAMNTAFVYQMESRKSLCLDGEECPLQGIPTHTAKFDLLFELVPSGGDMTLRIEYRTGKYDRAQIDRLAAAMERILLQLDRERLEEISVLSEEEYRQTIYRLNETDVPIPEGGLYERFLEQARRVPDHPAVVFRGEAWTYGQLARRSARLAQELRRRGIRKGQVVGCLLERSAEVIAAQLAVLCAGGSFLPIDARYPRERMEFMLADCRVSLLLHHGACPSAALHHNTLDLSRTDLRLAADACPPCPVAGDDVCYIIYTSGSTGTPKGCQLTHRGLMNFCVNNNTLPDVRALPIRRYLSVNTMSFDFFIAETLLPLLNGYTVVLADEWESLNGDAFGDLVLRSGANILQTTPTRLKLFLEGRQSREAFARLDLIVSSGEELEPGLLQRLRQLTRAKIYNPLGPSECSVWNLGGELPGDGTIAIGRPIANTRAYVLDGRRRPLPSGVPGELYIAGAGVGKGYLNRPDLTASRFLPDPFFPGQVMYRTGDLARLREDGALDYLGRADTQVKIRGLRIELGEIESVLAEFPGVRQAAAAGKRDGSGRQYLAGYYTSDAELDEAALRRHLNARLARYMTPNYLLRLEAMPMTPNGKLRRKDLPDPDFSRVVRNCDAPETENEKILCRLVGELLSLDTVGVTEDFFSLGGSSLQALSYVIRAHSLGIDFTYQMVFDFPTVRQLCEKASAGTVRPTAAYAPGAFEKYSPLLERNVMDSGLEPVRRPLGTVLLTGATGFLGAHILQSLLCGGAEKVFCLVRGGKTRLEDRLSDYFGPAFLRDPRICPIEGDLTRPIPAEALPEGVDLVIHAAALVKHYGRWEAFEQINIRGTRQAVEYAKRVGAKLLHISTISVSGGGAARPAEPSRQVVFDETAFYVGQSLENVYVRSKFEAERIVLDAMLEGLDAAIVRMGNLTNRAADLKFQPNYQENAFLKRIKAFLTLGMLPDFMLERQMGFTPVDLAAQAVVSIAQYADRRTVFHVSSDRGMRYDRFCDCAGALGFQMTAVPEERFRAALLRRSAEDGMEFLYGAFQNELRPDGDRRRNGGIFPSNAFTVWFLRRIGLEWPEVSREYIRGYFSYFQKLGFFPQAPQ